MGGPKTMAEQKEYLRFTIPQRLEHWILFVSFTGLVVTGIPQKFADYDWAAFVIQLLGGIEATRNIHHAAAVILSLACVYHVIVLAYKVFVLRVRWTMFPRLDDALDGLDAIRYNLGLTKEHPKFDRYNFTEKAEYWAMVWGTIIMGATGFMMWNPINFTRFFPGDLIPAAKAAHGAEAVLAALAIIVWHFYNVHIKTFSKAMFTGKMTEHQMVEEHALELARVQQGKVDVRAAQDVIRKRERIFIPVATVLSVAVLVVLYFFISYEDTALTTIPPRAAQQVPIYSPITPTPLPRAGVTPAPTGGSTAAAKPLPASHVGRTTCNACHANNVGPAEPADHAGRADATCTACHKAGSAPVPTAPSATVAPTAAPATGGSGVAKPLPADHAGRTTCVACHANGVGPAEPTDHAGRTDATCVACHK